MKKIFLVLLGAMMVCTGFAQIVEKGEPAIVYYSPKTSVSLDFTYTIEKVEKGVFAEYAKSLLGIDDVVTEDKTSYTLKDVRIATRAEADYARPHKVVNDPAMPMLLNINEKGLLVGYNLAPSAKKPNTPPQQPNNRRNAGLNDRFKKAPYPEEVLKAATPKAQAQAAAQQIFHIRETRMYLINGEVEHAPADGEAMRIVFEELEKQENALIALFTGKKSKRIEHKLVTFDPQAKDQKWYFSPENGFTTAENIDAEVISADVILYPQRYTASTDDAKNKKKAAVSQIVYNLPGSGEVKVVYNGKTLKKQTIAIAQLGVDVPLAKDLFTGKELPSIVFNEKTGNIVSISK